MKLSDLYYPHFRPLTLSVELHLIPHGERPGYSDDEHYVQAYWTQSEAEAYAARIMAAEMGTAIDVGHGRTLTYRAA